MELCYTSVMEDLFATIYVVRHGQTAWNIEKKVMGHEDVELNEKGKLQAMELATLLKDVPFDRIYSSDLLRCRQTADIVALKSQIAVETTKVLRERFYGRLQGKSWIDPDSELKMLWTKLARLTDAERKKHKLENVENDEDMLNRFIPFLREIALAYPREKILVVTHSGLMRLLLYRVGFLPVSDDPDFVENLPKKVDIKNSAYIKLETDGVDFNIRETFGIEVF